jgi:hypothetical protein
MMFKNTLIATALMVACAATLAQTAASPAKPATPAAPAAAATVPAPAAATPKAAPVAKADAKAAEAMPAVKKSNNDICHDATSSGYTSTKNFKPFATMDECIKSGGRAPKGSTPAKK